MKRVSGLVWRSFLMLCLSTFAFGYADRPSERFLREVGEERLAEVLKRGGIEDDPESAAAIDYHQHAEFFRNIVAQEDSSFIGYHATSVDHYIFQEFVKAVVERRNGWVVPEDFYFLRTPGESAYEIEGTRTIVKKFGRPDFSADELRVVVGKLIGAPIEHLSGCRLDWDGVDDAQIQRLYALVLTDALFSPTEGITKEEATQELQATLKRMIPSTLGANQRAKIEKAIKRFAKEPLKRDYEDLYADEVPYELIAFPYDDTSEELQRLVVSLNVPLYGNCFISSESTVHIFANNRSIEVDTGEFDEFEAFFATSPGEFFEGLNMRSVREVYDWAHEQLPNDTGIILQFFYMPKDSGSELDDICFVAGFFGTPQPERSVKSIIDESNGEWFTMPNNGLAFLVHEQIRLVMTNSVTLNPWSGLKIKQHDLIEPEMKEELRERIRVAVANVFAG